MFDQGYRYGMVLEEKKYSKLALDALVSTLKEDEVSLTKIVKDLALIFGSEGTLKEISSALTDSALPTKTIFGQTYVAGYKGTNIINAGNNTATLVDIVQSRGTDEYKLLFVVGNRYIYSVPLDIDLLSYIKNVNIKDLYIIEVKHDVIPNTGDLHAVVHNWYLKKV